MTWALLAWHLQGLVVSPVYLTPIQTLLALQILWASATLSIWSLGLSQWPPKAGPLLSTLHPSLTPARWELPDTLCEQRCSGHQVQTSFFLHIPHCHLCMLWLPHGDPGAGQGALSPGILNGKGTGSVLHSTFPSFPSEFLSVPIPCPELRLRGRGCLRQLLLPRFILSRTFRFLPERSLLSLLSVGNCSTL